MVIVSIVFNFKQEFFKWILQVPRLAWLLLKKARSLDPPLAEGRLRSATPAAPVPLVRGLPRSQKRLTFRHPGAQQESQPQ